MSPSMPRIAVIGIGSFNGDDQFGWQVVDCLERLSLHWIQWRKVQNPIDLLPPLSECDQAHIVDVAIGLPPPSLFKKLNFSQPRDREIIKEIPSRSSHDIGVYQTLRLAESLRKRTDHVTLWVGSGQSFNPLAAMSSIASRSVDACVGQLAEELCDARNVAC